MMLSTVALLHVDDDVDDDDDDDDVDRNENSVDEGVVEDTVRSFRKESDERVDMDEPSENDIESSSSVAEQDDEPAASTIFLRLMFIRPIFERFENERFV